MAGMRPFVLSEKFGAAYCTSLAAAGCPSSQIAIDKLSAVPLWKVIVGPAPTNCKPDPQGSGFLFRAMTSSVAALRPTRAEPLWWAAQMCNQRCVRILARTPEPIYSIGLNTNYQGRRPMAWTTPTLIEICVGLEINGYLPAEF